MAVEATTKRPARAWLRPLVTMALLGVAGFCLWLGVQSNSEVKPAVRRVGIARVFPEPGVVALRQDAIGAELDFGYSGRLAVDLRNIPDDQLDVIGGINRVSFTPGTDKEIVALDEGRHCVSLTYWPTAAGEETAGPPYVWCFTAA